MSIRSNLVGSCRDGTISQVSNAVKKDHKMGANMAVALKSKKRQACRQGDSRGMKPCIVSYSLMSHITQNIDCIEQRLPDLEAKTVRLHGQVDQARCQICNCVCAFDPHLFQHADLPDCQKCLARSEARVMKGKRSLRIGRLKPDVLLYGDPHPDDNEIIKVIKDGLAIRPDLVLIAGTKLRNLGAQSLAANFCHAARSVGGQATGSVRRRQH